jgi:hypothetical protein
MKFKCINSSGKRKVTWSGEINNIKSSKGNCEMEVTARGYFYHVIFGPHAYGNYLCVPNWNVGCELADYSDLFWNTERLSRIISNQDAITIATAVREVSQILNG